MARGRWWQVGVLAAVVAVLLVVLVVRLREDTATSRSGAFVIGDSITVMAGVEGSWPESWTVDAVSGRTTAQGVEVAKATDLSDVPVVIVALGTNDALDDAPTYGARVDQMLAAIGPGPTVIWVNVDANTPQLASAEAGVNAALTAAAERHRNLRVADWDTYVAGIADRADLRTGDGVHYAAGGSELRRTWMQGLVAL